MKIILVVRDEARAEYAGMAVKYKFSKPFRFSAGGAERQDSVWNGLESLNPLAEIVAIQDAARPCASAGLIEATVDAARRDGAAVAAQPVSDTIKQSDDGRSISRHLDRSRLWAVQTPQTFRVEVIRRALAKVREMGLAVTDDTAACELIGQPVTLISGWGPNPKATLPEDVPYIELLLQGKS
ncbi:MAG TPA: IspD/TarI family cytidylyltransferase [Humisphaera sp.]|nr:IspD/TarI family cytidylyltransferase [Humisphaera sp.]